MNRITFCRHIILFAIYAIKRGNGDDSMREIKFKAFKDTHDGDVCTTDIPSRVVKGIKSRIRCTLLCEETSGCYSVNWKEPSTCEMYHPTPIQFGSATYCTHFSPAYSVLIIRIDQAGSNAGFFNRPWTPFQQGFGSPTSQYWIGLDRLHEVSQRNCKVRFDFQDTAGTWHFAQYYRFKVGSSSTNYVLEIDEFAGDTGYDAMAYHNGRQFTTYDSDHDGWAGGNCASNHGGGFWHNSCLQMGITTTPASSYFYWGTPNGVIRFNTAQVRLLC